ATPEPDTDRRRARTHSRRPGRPRLPPEPGGARTVATALRDQAGRDPAAGGRHPDANHADQRVNPLVPDIVEIGVTLPGRDLATAHTIHQALPGRSWPVGRAVATTTPELYQDLPIPVFQIDM